MNAPVRAINITRKEKEYQGMLEYKQGDETRLLKNLVIGMLNSMMLELHANIHMCSMRFLWIEYTLCDFFLCCDLRFEASWCSCQLHSWASSLHHLHVPTICRQCE